jgi:peroxiredoxin
MRQTRIVVTFIFSLLILQSCSKKEAPKTASSTIAQGNGNVAEAMNVVKRADKIPNFSWKDNAGNVVDFDTYHGKITLINFWATWCGPCKKELPDLVAISRELSGRGVKVIGISVDRGSNIIDDVRTFVQEHDIPYQVVVANDDLEEAFNNIRMIPTSFLVDADGKIIQTLVGQRTKESLSQSITALLK